ncbi:MAG: hybrid sensor histidine kinase/response regulator [Anaerolineae bacterium]|nr:hybrid sensor histidine kinase/response regulator [Anaerolineae bacterium]
MSVAEADKGSILVVDDTLDNLRLLVGMLVKHGYKVRAVTSGQRALDTVHLALPDLILLDVSMPKMNGYEVCERLKADERTHDIPIIFLSALDETQHKVKAFTVGGVDYITKPFQFEEVLARVETHLAFCHLQKQLQAANRELAHSNALLAAQNAELDAFAHTVAHDLKNPLGIMVGYTTALETLYDEMSSQELEDYMHKIAQTGRKMVNIVDELLLLASVRKQQDIDLAPLDMARIVREAQKRLSHMIDAAQVEIVVPDEWPLALGYAPWVEEVWVNFISNAIKYGGTPPRVELGACPPSIPPCGREDVPSRTTTDSTPSGVADSSPPVGGTIRFWVRDNGPGLTEQDGSRLFTQFTRLHRARAQGHGLGLSIVRRIVEKLGGEVGVDSKIGEGSIFYFTLPAYIDQERTNPVTIGYDTKQQDEQADE